MVIIYDRQEHTFFRIPGRITGCARLEELTDNWNSTVVFARVESANGRVDFYNLMRYSIKEEQYMTMLELATRNTDYELEKKLEVKHNGNWIGIFTVSELVYRYGLCEIIYFNNTKVSLIGEKLS